MLSYYTAFIIIYPVLNDDVVYCFRLLVQTLLLLLVQTLLLLQKITII